METSGTAVYRSYSRARLAPAKRDRRHNARFPIILPVRYKLARNSGTGQTINIGSSGALLTVGHPVKRGDRIELSIGWPVLLHQKVHLNLIAHGTIVRADEDRAAVKFEQYHFRTASAGSRVHHEKADEHRAPAHRKEAATKR